MEAKNLLQADLLDIVFENRNKAYGAYELRKQYNARLSAALLVTGSLILIAFLSSFLHQPAPAKVKPAVSVMELSNFDLEPMPEKPIEEPKPKESKPVKTEQYVTMVVEPDKNVTEEVKPPTVEELENAEIGTKDIEGEATDGRVRVEGEGEVNVVVEAPVVKDQKPFTRVEIEAEFPGGNKAWHQYISREIERNMDELQDEGKSGTVVVQFVVDAEGNVSDVKLLGCAETGVSNCISGNSKLSEIAIAAIKRGPKWKPAEQNGRMVKAYRRQPVTFRLHEAE